MANRKGLLHISIGALGMLILFLIAYVIISQISPDAGAGITDSVADMTNALGNVFD